MAFTKRSSARRGEGAFGAIAGLGILVLVAIALFKVVPLHVEGNEVLDAMSEAANFASVKQDEKLRYDIYTRAQKAGAPVPLTEIKISRPGQAVKISVQYQKSVSVLGYDYVYKFDKTVEKQTF